MDGSGGWLHERRQQHEWVAMSAYFTGAVLTAAGKVGYLISTP